MRIGNAETGGFTELDRHFADFLSGLDPARGRGLWLASALVSLSTRMGHVCADLPSHAAKQVPGGGAGEREGATFPPLGEWIGGLKTSPMVGTPGQRRPLVLDGSSRLYLHRYWRYERILADFLRERSGQRCEGVDEARLEEGLERLFPEEPGVGPDLRRDAARVAVRGMLSVVTGGPGTGKTSTVVRILALLLEQAEGKRLAMALTAPTGKAAARLKGAVRAARETLNTGPRIRDLIPGEASTLHRLLGAHPGGGRPRFHQGNPLPHDVVVVDEASMVDLPLMARLAAAVPRSGRLILLGDRDQLASVEPGAVFGDISDGGGGALSGSLVALRRSYRFGEGSGIGVLARAVNEGEGDKALQILSGGGFDDIGWRDAPPLGDLSRSLEAAAIEGFSGYLRAGSPGEAFERLTEFRILCALRGGPYGVESANRVAERALAGAGLIRPRGRWYAGQPVLVTKNDYSTRLFNGDVGVLLRDPESGDGGLRAFFPMEGGGYRKILPARLPDHETAYAMTVHKSQGSEFGKVLLLLPDSRAELLTRELLYTGISRAKRSVELWGAREVFLWAVSRRISRQSGLREALVGEIG